MKDGTAVRCELGVVGLGVMGRNLALNIADHGFPVAGYDRESSKVAALTGASGKNVRASGSLAEFVGCLRPPRVVLMLVPAGPPVDAVIHDVLPLVQPGDVLVDGGNSHYTETDRRFTEVSANGLYFLGTGISGGERGARTGPSLMPGGPREAYDRVRPVFEAIAARVNGDRCVAFLGPRSAGHYVKMVHNGIEYALMQLISETYDLMKRGLGLDDDQLYEVYDEWSRGEAGSYLLEITARIFLKRDERTGARLVDLVLDHARQKGTGKWTSQEAMERQVPVPTIDAAVSARDLSGQSDERQAFSEVFPPPSARIATPPEEFIRQLRGAFYFGMIAAYAQGMDLLRQASIAHGYGIPLHEVAKIWRGGCIIRAALLERVRQALESQPGLPNVMLDKRLSGEIARPQGDTRAVIRAAAEIGLPAPALMASLAYFDSLRSRRLPANLIQAQRDSFGSHTYERTDAAGVFHTEWLE
jgi:6-phosphogluconate dehydrogenase